MNVSELISELAFDPKCVCVCVCVWGGGSKAKALQACLISITAARWKCEQEVSDQKKIVYLRKQVELNQVGI